KAVVFSSPVMCVKKMTEDMGDCINELGPELSAAIWEAEASHDYSTEGFMQGMGAMLSRHVCRLPEWPACIAAAQQKTGGLVYMTMWGTQQFTCNGLLKEFDVRADLDKIKVPALFVCGEYDYCKPKTGEEYSKQVADGTLLVIEDGAHQAHVEFPDLYKEKVSAWLAEKL
ncbi:MAG: alpha/beta hydrolase, partial [Clostridiales bacterium]|nr:alpha/beta hydrolase [Clostridiales bacterium]